MIHITIHHIHNIMVIIMGMVDIIATTTIIIRITTPIQITTRHIMVAVLGIVAIGLVAIALMGANCLLVVFLLKDFQSPLFRQ